MLKSLEIMSFATLHVIKDLKLLYDTLWTKLNHGCISFMDLSIGKSHEASMNFSSGLVSDFLW